MPNTAQGTLIFLSHVIVTTMPMRQLCHIFSTTQMRKVAQRFLCPLYNRHFLSSWNAVIPRGVQTKWGQGRVGKNWKLFGILR